MTRPSARRSRRAACLIAAPTLALLVGQAQGAGYQRPGEVERISMAFDGSQAQDPVDTAIGLSSWESAISADGRYVAFSSTAVNLVVGDANQASDIFVRDRITNKTEIVSVASDGTKAAGACANGATGSTGPSISANGRFVSFSSCAANLVPGDLNLARDGFVHDRLTHRTEMVTVSSAGKQGTLPLLPSHDSFASSISPDGRFVAISSYASDLIPDDTNGLSDAFLFDRVTRKIQRVSVSSTEEQTTSTGPLAGHSHAASVSSDGKFVLFNSHASNLVPGDTNAAIDGFVRDIAKGTTERVTVRTGGGQTHVNGGAGATASGGRAISADGRFVMFSSWASNLVPNDTNGAGLTSKFDIFVRDRKTGRTERVSVGSDGHEANDSTSPGSISLDGRYVAMASSANNLVEGDTGINGGNSVTVGAQPGDEDVFLYDRRFGTMEMLSRAPNGDEAKGHCKIPNDALAPDASESFGGAVSTGGAYVSFQSCATNLVPGDTNKTRDQFVRHRGPHLGMTRVGASGGGTVTFSGWSTFSGAVLASAADPADDGALDAGVTGSEIVNAELLYRPEVDDLLLRVDLTLLPSVGVALGGISGPGDPRVVYSLRFAANGQTYEVRVSRAGVNATNPLDASYGLFTCTELVCNEVAGLRGGYGTTGEQIVVSIPMALVTKGGKPVGEGAVLSGLRAYTGYGTYLGGVSQLLDQVLLTKAPSVLIPAKSVTVTAGKATVRAKLVNGRFTAAFPRQAVGSGRSASLLIRTCLGTECQQSRLAVAL